MAQFYAVYMAFVVPGQAGAYGNLLIRLYGHRTSMFIL
jgi:hypothetical protein